MAESIGPRIEVQGEKEFKSAMKDITSEFKLLKSEMKLAASQFDRNDKSTQALTVRNQALGREMESHKRKMSLLTTQYDKQNNKLATLKTSLDATKAAFGADSAEVAKAQREYDRQNNTVMALQTQLNGTEAALNNLDRALQDNNRAIALQENRWTQLGNTLNDVSSRMKKVGDGMKNVGKDLSMSVTAPILGLGAAAVKVGMDFEAAMSNVAAISGATGEDLKKLGDKAKEMGSKTSKSATESADALGFMALAGWDTTQMIGGLEPILRLSEAGNMDLALASDIVTDSMSSLGVEVKDLPGYLDKMAKASTKSNTTVTQLGEAFVIAGGTFKNLNVPLAESNAILGILANRGLKGSEAANSLNSIMINLTTGAGQAGTAMKELNIEAFDSEGKFKGMGNVLKEVNDKTKNMTEEQKNLYLAMIGGKTQLTTLQALTDGVGKEFDELQGHIEDSEGALNKMADTMADNTKGGITQLKSALEGLGITASETLLPMVNKVVGKLQDLADKFASLTPKQQETIIKLALFAATIGPVLIITGSLISAIGTIVGALGAVSAAMGVASVATAGVGTAVGATAASAGAAALLFNPVTLAIGAIGLAAVGVGLALRQEVIPTIDLFGGQVSKATEKAVTSYMDLNDKVGVSLLSFQANNTIITTKIAEDMVQTFTKMGADIKTGRDKHHADDLANLTKFYTDQGLINTKEAQDALAKMEQNHIDRATEVDDHVAQIAAIQKKAADANRSNTQKELDEIIAIKKRMEALAIQALTDSEAEQAAILTRMRLQAKDMSTKQAGEVIAASAKQRDGTTKLANDQYEKVVATISRQRKEGVITSDDQARKMIAAAERQRTATINKAQDTHAKVVYELQKQNSDVVGKINEQDGTVKNSWQNLRSWFSNNPIVRWITTHSKSAGGSVAGGIKDIDDKSSGTNNFQGGLTTLHEKGYEVYDLPSKTRIFNHEASEDMVLKTAREVAKGVLASNQGGGLSVKIGTFVNNRKQDVQAFAEELEFYRRQAASGRGGI